MSRLFTGAEVKPGDILVGKVTPKSETFRPEEKLLRSIFGEKAGRMDSLKLPSGSTGVVIDASFTRHGIDKDERSIAIERSEIGVLKRKSGGRNFNRNIK